MYDPEPKRGLQLLMDRLDPLATRGLLAQAREAARAGIVSEGLLDRQKALALASAPLRLAVVTLKEGEVLADVQTVFAGSGFAVVSELYPTILVGNGAARSVASTIASAQSAGHDAILVVRGGGPKASAVAFETAEVARAIATASVPVLTGLGHAAGRHSANSSRSGRGCSPGPGRAARRDRPPPARGVQRMRYVAGQTRRWSPPRPIVPISDSLALAARFAHPVIVNTVAATGDGPAVENHADNEALVR